MTNDNVTKQTEEFDRSICMSFFNDHRALVKRIERLHGIEMAYKIQSALIDYGLDGIKPTEEELLQYIPEPVLNQIDNNQKRRAKSFKGEDLEVSQSIILLHRDRPEMSQNAIANALGVSKGKVNKTLQKYNNGEYEGVIDFININTPINTSTSIPTSNDCDQRDRLTVHSTASTMPTEEQNESRREKRILEDLTDEELVELDKDFKREMTYKEIQKKYNLSQECTNAHLGKNIKAIQDARVQEKEKQKSKERFSKIEMELFKYPEKKAKLMNFTECKSDDMLLRCLRDIDRNIDDIIAFYEDNIDSKNDKGEPSFTRWTWKSRMSGDFSTYEVYIQEVMDSNGYSKVS